MSPDRIIVRRDGELAAYYPSKDLLPGGASARYGTLVLDADGDVTALVEDRAAGTYEAFDATDVVAALARIEAFIR